MASLGNYFIDGSTLQVATAVFTTDEMTTAAPDGFYSDGVVVREQVNGLLTNTVVCPSCVFPCGQAIAANGGQGIYDVTFSTGSSTGCVIIYFNAQSVPDGIRVLYNNQYYNELTSPAFGFLASDTPNSDHYTFIGSQGSDCNIGNTLNGGGYSGLNTFEFNGSGFTNTGSQGVVTGDSGDVKLTAASPGYSTLYIPKPFNAPENVTVQIFGPCTGTAWNIEINCPIDLTSVHTSGLAPGPCLTENLPNDYYNIPNRGGIAGDPQINEFFVQDPQGNTKVPAGQYVIEVGSQRRQITVSTDGIITAMTVCT